MVSGKTGHTEEFVSCHETRQLVAAGEAEQCEVTGKLVRPGVLEACQVSHKRALPSELGTCSVTDKKVLKSLLVASSVSSVALLPDASVRSLAGRYCAPAEAVVCAWSGAPTHPEDVRICSLTGVAMHSQFLTSGPRPRLRPLVELLDGSNRAADMSTLWEPLSTRVSAMLKVSKCKVDAAVLGPTPTRLAACVEIRTLFGLRYRYAGLVYSINDRKILGRIVQGQRSAREWAEAR